MAASLNELPDGNLSTLSPMADESEASKSIQAVEDVVFGSVAGAIGKVFEYPFDTVKVRLQSQRTSVYKNSLDCFQQAVRSDGVIRGLYRGLSAPVVGAAVETSSLFFSYGISQDLLLRTLYKMEKGKDDLPMDALLTAGAMSGAFTSLWLTPIELVKCQMQVPLAPGSVHGPGVISVIGNVLQHNGPLGFWHGQLGTLIREAGGSAAWFGVYEGAKKFFKNQNIRRHASSSPSGPTLSHTQTEAQLHIIQRLAAGACAGVAYNFAFFPADTIKSRMQTEVVGPGKVANITSPKQPDVAAAVLKTSTGSTIASPKMTNAVRAPNFWSTSKTIWKEAGLRGMYRGCGITVARSAISSPIIFTIYESLKGWRES